MSTITTAELIMMTAKRGTATVCAVSVFLCAGAVAQEGYYGVGHQHWHMEFYSKLNRNDGKGSCCNLYDCRRRKAAGLVTITRSRLTANGHGFPMTRSITWWRLMVALTSARRGRRVRTRVFYFVSFCRR